MWIARDKDGCLYSYEEKPWRQEVDKMWIDFPIYLDYKLDGIGCITQLDSDLYPELTWDNEPIEVNSIPKKSIKELKMNDFCWSCKFCREDSLSWEEDRYCSCQNEDSDNYLVRIDLIKECKDYSND